MTYPKLTDLDPSVHPQVATAIEAAREWAERKSNGEEGISMIFAGPNGTGKTHIATAIQWSILYKPEPDVEYEMVEGSYEPIWLEQQERPLGRFYKAADLLTQIGATVGNDGRILPAPVDYFVGNSPIIVLDDLGAAVSLPFVKGEMQREEIQVRLFLLLEHCMGRTKIERDWEASVAEVKAYPPSLIITTNLDIGNGDDSEFAKYVGERVWSRLMDICPKGFMVNMRDVPDFRKKRSGR